MAWLRARQRLMATACLDAAGLIGLGMAISRLQGLKLNPHSIELLLLLVVIYCSFGWLLGSYTLLKLPRVSWTQSLARLGSSALASVAATALIRDLFRLQISNRLIFGSNLLLLFLLLTVWSALIRLLFRHQWPNQQQTYWQILALPKELDEIEREWPGNQPPEQIRVITNMNQITAFGSERTSKSLALSCGVIGDQNQQLLCQNALDQGIPVNSIVELAEQELQRIPPRWVGNQWILFSNRIDGTHSAAQDQLKRYADVLISIVLLILSAPLILVAGLMVKLQDGGPVLYRQQRTGLLGQPFQILKIRTMCTTAEAGVAQWARIDDQRITPIGRWLRKTRLDELPQLLNVLQGDMSLIGPRPERPELEKQLEEEIPNYRLRHWIRPGLSGWAQVNMHYSSSIREAELKLSYDLYYLRNANLLLDLLILFKTIKIILKAAGR
jgi:exopolysaccharide biosynthesis polyprenyl glycosylphosphotransferase